MASAPGTTSSTGRKGQIFSVSGHFPQSEIQRTHEFGPKDEIFSLYSAFRLWKDPISNRGSFLAPQGVGNRQSKARF
jgi:hypothetical protein